jgi:hypothetical protein
MPEGTTRGVKNALAIPEEFYRADAMLTDDWKGPDFKLRHTYTRFAIPGFHGRVSMTRATTTLAQLAGVYCVARSTHDIIWGTAVTEGSP